MKYSASLLAAVSATTATAADLGRDFTINLLTRYQDFSASFPQVSPYQVPIHYNNATIKHVYGDDNVLYSVIGSLTFNETDKVQTYHLDADQWAADVSPISALEWKCEDHMLMGRSIAAFKALVR
jgi:hypothetical protein